MNIPIVIAAFDRKHTLNRLLSSLAKGYYSNPVKLIISIDGGGADNVKTIARDFEWKFGPKEVIEHPQNMGLRRHILFCGGLSQQYDGIILLEDDLYVSPCFYTYTLAALEHYKNCSSICGISLYSYRHNETSLLPFIPLNDGTDTFFMQLPSSWGQAWLKAHWQDFERWYAGHCNEDYACDPSLPINIALWPKTSWKKYFAKYLIEVNKFIVYPMNSYSTNFGDRGIHHQGSYVYQVPPLLNEIRDYVFAAFDKSLVKYDSHSELLPECLNGLCGGMFDAKFSVDMHGTRKIESISTKFVLTSKPCSSYIRSFGRSMTPIELNIINDIDGEGLYFVDIKHIKDYGNIYDFILERAANIQYQQYYLHTDTYHYSLLHRAENKINELYQEGQLMQASLRESRKLLLDIYNSFSWRLTAPLRKSVDIFRRQAK